MHRRNNGLSSALNRIYAATSDEVEVDSLTISRFETLSAADYHLGTLYVPHPKTMTPAQRSAIEAIGGGIWDATLGAARIFSSGASMVSMPGSLQELHLPRLQERDCSRRIRMQLDQVSRFSFRVRTIASWP